MNYLIRMSRVLSSLQAFNLPFTLSTSTIPVNYVKRNPSLDFRHVLGGFGPVTEYGYAACYVHHGDNICKSYSLYTYSYIDQGRRSRGLGGGYSPPPPTHNTYIHTYFLLETSCFFTFRFSCWPKCISYLLLTY